MTMQITTLETPAFAADAERSCKQQINFLLAFLASCEYSSKELPVQNRLIVDSIDFPADQTVQGYGSRCCEAEIVQPVI